MINGQKISTHSCCTAAPGDSSATPAHAVQPCDVSLVASVRPHLVLVGVSDLRRNSGDWNPSVSVSDRSHQSNGGAGPCHHPYEGLKNLSDFDVHRNNWVYTEVGHRSPSAHHRH